ncbi:MAG: hypothetical protein WED82_03030, partial [Balneolales bacterium]
PDFSQIQPLTPMPSSTMFHRLFSIVLLITALIISGCSSSYMIRQSDTRLIMTDGESQIEVPKNEEISLKWYYKGLVQEPHVINNNLSGKDEYYPVMVKLLEVERNSMIIIAAESSTNRAKLPDYAGEKIRTSSGFGYRIPFESVAEIRLPSETSYEPEISGKYKGNLLLDGVIGAAGGALITGIVLRDNNRREGSHSRTREAVSTRAIFTGALAGAIVYPLFKLITRTTSQDRTEYIERKVDTMITYEIGGSGYRLVPGNDD